MMKILTVLLFVLSFAGFTLADVPAPPVAREIRIELAQNYPDYQFYLCSYKIAVKPNPNPPHPSRPEMIVSVPESFEQKLIELNLDQPLSQPITSHIPYRGDKLSEKIYWLVAIKKSQVQELEPKIKSAVFSSTALEGFKLVRLEDSLPVKGDERKGAKTVVNKVSIDAQEMKVKVEEGTSGNGSSFSCFGIGLFLTGLALTGGWWTKKRFV